MLHSSYPGEDGPGRTTHDLAELLSLEMVGPDEYRSSRNDENMSGEIFGGQYLGQALWAAMATASGRTPHALYGFFLRSGRASGDLRWTVERTREGRSFTHRRVTGWQEDRELFRAEVSLHRPEDGQPEHQRAMPDVPRPETLRSLHQLADQRSDMLGNGYKRLTQKQWFEIRPVSPDVGMGAAGTDPQGRYWIRAAALGATDDASHYAALAYLSDAMANATSRLIHTSNLYDDSLAALTLNHGLWFHRRPMSGDWLLYDLESSSAASGLGINRGLLYGRDGTLYASTMQDALIRRA